jgi:hypothetical protein
MTAHHEHVVGHWHDEHVSGMQQEVKKPLQMEKGHGLARVPKVADESGKRHAGRAVFVIAQPLDVDSLDVRLREERRTLSSCPEVVQRNEVGVLKPGPNLSSLKKSVDVIWAVGIVDDDFPAQRSVESEVPAMRTIQPQRIA